MTPDEQRQQRIRDRAYILSLAHDGALPEENWLRAEQEIRAEEEAEIRLEATARGHEVGIRQAFTHP
jgi:hypothetical protein